VACKIIDVDRGVAVVGIGFRAKLPARIGATRAGNPDAVRTAGLRLLTNRAE